MATGTSEASADNDEASSTEVMELIPGKIKTTYIKDIYIKSDAEQNFFCNVVHLTWLDIDRIVVVDDAVSIENSFDFSKPEAGKFRVKLLDTGLNQVVSVLDVRGKFTGVSNINETQLAVCVNGNTIILLRADKTLTVERRLKFPRPHAREKYDITHLSTYKGDLYICSRENISKIDLTGKSTEVFKSIKHNKNVVIVGRWSWSPRTIVCECLQNCVSGVIYTNGDELFIYAINTDRYSPEITSILLTHKRPYLAHGTEKKGVMDQIQMPGEPKVIAMDDERELLFVLLYVKKQQRSWFYSYKEYYVIYVLRPGTTDGCVLLGEADCLQDVTSMTYCSKTRQLFVGFKENNYVKVYQLSSVP